MSPPNGVKPVSAGGNSKPVDPKEERKAYLKSSEFLVDPSDKDPAHLQTKWESDSDYRVKNFKLINLMDLFTRFMNRDSDVTPQKMKAAIDSWTGSPEFAADPINKVVLANMYRILGKFEDPGNADQAAKLRATLPPPPAVEAPPVEVKGDGKGKADESKVGTTAPTGWRFNAITFNTHFADDTMRVLPSGYTLGIIPQEGFGQNQSSTFAISAGTEFSFKDFGFFAEAYYNDAKPLGALNSASPTLGDPQYNAKFGQAGVKFGMVEYSDTMRYGKRGQGFNIGLLGRSRVGIGLGSGWCSDITNPVNGAKCSGSNFQLSIVDDTDFFSMGYGPVELGVRLLPGTTYLNFGNIGLPDTNRVPIEFFANYHFNSPYVGGDPQTPDDFLAGKTKVTDAQITMSALMVASDAVRANASRKTESAYQEQRIVSLGLDRSDKQYGTLNAGTMIGGLISGWGEGSLAYRLAPQFRYGNNGQRIGLGAVLGTELGINLIGLAATPGLPSQADYLAGKTDGITNLQARAFRLNVPVILVRDGLAGLGALGAFGDLSKAIKDGGGQTAWWVGAHGTLAVGGLVMILTSGIGNGTGFFGKSILGNQAPNTDHLEVVGSDYDYPAQNGQYYRLAMGSAFLSYGVNGALQYFLDLGKYNSLKTKQYEKDKPGAGPSKDPTKPDINVGFNTDGRTKFQIGVNGTF